MSTPVYNPIGYADGLYSHYDWVKRRILNVSNNRIIAGFMEAQDWPPKNLKTSAFYLLNLVDSPPGKEFDSIQNPVTVHQLQWVWIIIGTDVQATQRAANRGDRYQIAQAMKGELTYALYPRFTEKKSWSLDGSGKFVGASKNPVEYVFWTATKPTERLDKNSGLVYGTASVELTDMLDQIPA